MEVVVELLDKNRKTIWKGSLKRDGYCYIGELPKSWGWTKRKGLVIVYSQLISETRGNRRYIARVPDEILRNAEYLRLVKGKP